jgi:hypothetical protein
MTVGPRPGLGVFAVGIDLLASGDVNGAGDDFDTLLLLVVLGLLGVEAATLGCFFVADLDSFDASGKSSINQIFLST